MDIYFSASKNGTLDDTITACQPVNVGNPKFDKKSNQPISNYIQVQVFLTVRTNQPKEYFRPNVMPMFSAQDIRKGDMDALLRVAHKNYIAVCKDRYEVEKEYMGALSKFKDDGMLARYYSDNFAAEFNRRLEYHTKEEKKQQEKEKKFGLSDSIEKAKHLRQNRYTKMIIR